MTEADWDRCTDPQKMLRRLYRPGKVNERKCRLFACACLQAVWCYLPDQRSRHAVDFAERFADGGAGLEDLQAAGAAAVNATWDVGEDGPTFMAAHAACYAAAGPGGVDAMEIAAATALDPGLRLRQAAVLHDIIGPTLFREIRLDPRVLAENDATVEKLALAAYDDRLLPSGHLDSHRLAILADALEEAGCTSAEVLNHCRQPGVHVRGCWLLDLCLQKG